MVTLLLWLNKINLLTVCYKQQKVCVVCVFSPVQYASGFGSNDLTPVFIYKRFVEKNYSSCTVKFQLSLILIFALCCTGNFGRYFFIMLVEFI